MHPNLKLCFDCTLITWKFEIEISKLSISTHHNIYILYYNVQQLTHLNSFRIYNQFQFNCQFNHQAYIHTIYHHVTKYQITNRESSKQKYILITHHFPSNVNNNVVMILTTQTRVTKNPMLDKFKFYSDN